ncbi:MAG: hypothetical protein AAFQ86_01330 [Bacteroidota bacterium]
MLLTSFPDLACLKSRIATPRAWPTVLLQVKAHEAYRPDVLGPLSLFANVAGASVIRSEGMATRIPPGTYALTNAGAPYTLEIEGAAETQNLHVRGATASAIYRALVTPDDHLLDAPDAEGRPLTVVPRLYTRTTTLDRLLARAFEAARATPAALDEAVADVLVHLLSVHRGALHEAARVPAARAVTRAEVYQRLVRSVDLMHATPEAALPLDGLAAAACLSTASRQPPASRSTTTSAPSGRRSARRRTATTRGSASRARSGSWPGRGWLSPRSAWLWGSTSRAHSRGPSAASSACRRRATEPPRSRQFSNFG